MAGANLTGEMKGKTGNAFTDTLNLIGAPMVIRVLLVLSIVLFLFPMVTISCSTGDTVTFSGTQLIVGTTYTAEYIQEPIVIKPQIYVILSAVLFIAAAVAAFMTPTKLDGKTSKTPIITTGILIGIGTTFTAIFMATFPFVSKQYTSVISSGLAIAVYPALTAIPFVIFCLSALAIFFVLWQIRTMDDTAHMGVEPSLFDAINAEVQQSELERKKHLTELALSTNINTTPDNVGTIFSRDELKAAGVVEDEFTELVPGSEKVGDSHTKKKSSVKSGSKPKNPPAMPKLRPLKSAAESVYGILTEKLDDEYVNKIPDLVLNARKMNISDLKHMPAFQGGAPYPNYAPHPMAPPPINAMPPTYQHPSQMPMQPRPPAPPTPPKPEASPLDVSALPAQQESAPQIVIGPMPDQNAPQQPAPYPQYPYPPQQPAPYPQYPYPQQQPMPYPQYPAPPTAPQQPGAYPYPQYPQQPPQSPANPNSGK